MNRETPKGIAGRTALYRHFDSDGDLLYVGISMSALLRLSQHASDSDWSYDIATVTIEWFETRPEAMEAERTAILREHPKHNSREGLNVDDVREIVERIQAGEGNSQIAPDYGISSQNISSIRKGQTWAAFTASLGFIPERTPRAAPRLTGFHKSRHRRGSDRSRLDRSDVREIVRLFEQGHTNRAIAKRFPVGENQISLIRMGRAWRKVTSGLGYAPPKPRSPSPDQRKAGTNG